MGFRRKRTFPLALFLMASVAGLFSFPAGAQGVEKLDKKVIKEFIERTSLMSHGGDYETSQEEVIDYLDHHIHDNARFVTKMQFILPGMAPQETKMSLEKKGFLDGVRNGEKAVDHYENEIEIKGIKISRDKKNATVITVGKEMAEMPTKLDSGATQYVPIEGISNCTQILRLEEGIIKMFNANCTTTIEFQNF